MVPPIDRFPPAVLDALRVELYRYVCRLGVSHEDAQDIVQRVFVQLLELRELPPDEEQVRRLVFRIARRRHVDDIRRKVVRALAASGRLKEEAAALPPVRDAEKWRFIEELLAALTREAPDRAEILRLHLFHGMDDHAIAEILDMKNDTVRAEISRARAWLRTRFPQ